MVITCPSCSARYRLNPDKIQGRGAKITCPKCAHVFVVFTDRDGAEPAPEAAVEEAPSPRVKRPARPSADDSHGLDPETTTGAFKAVGVDLDDAARASSSNIRVVAPGTRSTRRMRTIDGGYETGEVSVPSSAPQAGTAEGGTHEVQSAADLDFRSVGIKTWKVKVAIGLIYDFSDIATLKKYLSDKKVTPDDLISHNNKDWIRIGDIQGLDRHFIETWRKAKAAVDSGESPAPEKKSPSTGSHKTLGHQTGSMTATTRTGSFRAEDTSSNKALATGAYGAAVDKPLATRRRAKAAVAAAEAAAEPPPRRATGPVLAVVVLLGVAAVWKFWPAGVMPDDLPPPSPIAIEDLGPTDREREAIKKSIEEKLKDAQARAAEEAQVAAGVAAAADEAADDPRRLVPVRPSEQKTVVQQSPIREATRQPTGEYQQPILAPPTPQRDGSSAVVTATSKADPSRMYYTAGKTKLDGGDFGSARKMFEQATSKNPNCGECWAGLAEAEKQLGNAAAAAAAASKASALGSPTSMASP